MRQHRRRLNKQCDAAEENMYNSDYAEN